MTRRNRNKSRPPSPAKRPSSPQSSDQNERHAISTVEQHTFSGPVPHPDILSQYDSVVSGSAERIISMAEKEAIHTHTMERNALAAARSESKYGQVFGLLIGISALLVSAYALYLGHSTAASIIGGTTVVGLVTVFVTGRNSGES